mmetsp:Transcript_26727/g.46335  ORF Transcript_26727/g.46335 Transcript_26727/m.46335 type:complete len:382 (-) Transcript_26727:130-1275(-)
MPRHVDFEDATYRGLSKAQVEEEVWKKEVADLAKFGVNLADDHMEGYLYKPERKELSLISKPWEKDLIGEAQVDTSAAFGKADSVCEATVEGYSNPSVNIEEKPGMLIVTFNRPEANNAINGNITKGLGDAVTIIKKNPSKYRVMVLKANGRMFCAGGDPKAFQASQGVQFGVKDASKPPPGSEITDVFPAMSANTESAKAFAKLLYDLSILPCYTIACVQGSAMGGGVGFMSVCDMVIAVKNAHVVLSEVKLGVIPATISPYVVGKMGAANAKRLFCTAESLKANAAMQAGLVNYVIDNNDGFEPLIKDTCAKIQAVAPQALAAAKRSMNWFFNQAMDQSMLEFTAKEYARIRKGEEAESGMKALISKKKPEWMERVIEP